jgi:flagellar biosynthesis protein FlhB
MADKQSKTEAGTPRRIEEARKKGQFPKSPEISVAVTLLLLVLFATTLFPLMAATMTDALQASVQAAAAGPAGAPVVYAQAVRMLLVGAGPLIAVGVLGALGAGLTQTRGQVFPKALQVKITHLDPRNGLKTFGLKRVASNFGVTFVKVALLGLSVAGPMRRLVTRAETLTQLDQTLGVIGHELISILWRVVAVAIVVAVFDYKVKYSEWKQSLKMERHEVVREWKDAEGDPLVKQARRRMALRWLSDRGPEAVVDAAVVVVNPTHVAIALRYGDGDVAPVVLTKGTGAKAQAIRRAARQHKVPIVRDVKLAWRLLETVEVGEAVPGDLYAAVGEVIAVAIRHRPELATVVERAIADGDGVPAATD